VCAAGAGAFGQSFECYPVGPLPMDPSLGCEGVASNNLGILTPPVGVTEVTNVQSCGFPTVGVNYLRVTANGPGFQVPPNYPAFLPPVGGPFPRPVPNMVTEVRIPIPMGATALSMDWDFFNHECPGVPPQNSYYDGMSVDVVNSGGSTIANLIYVDTGAAEGTCSIGNDYCNLTNPPSLLSETVPSGPNAFVGVLPPLTGCEYISIAIWNGNDNSYPSCAYFDNIQFNSVNGACPVPCFVTLPGPPTLQFSSPSGPGCILATMTNLPSSGFYFLAITLQAGSYPNGWFFGIDIGFPELLSEINTGFPFLGPLTGSPCGVGGATIGQFCGAPNGLTIYAVGLAAPNGSSYPSITTPAVSYTIP
jgi:hypothetical protein